MIDAAKSLNDKIKVSKGEATVDKVSACIAFLLDWANKEVSYF
jgi:hypothetical protein